MYVVGAIYPWTKTIAGKPPSGIGPVGFVRSVYLQSVRYVACKMGSVIWVLSHLLELTEFALIFFFEGMEW